MAKKILIVESDSGLSGRMRAQLEQKGFTVQETTDAKNSLETIRRERPELVVMGVELGQGQNGYILCGKLKKDDDLKAIPLIIVGNPDGFAQHKKLKTRADEYVANKKGDMNVGELVDRAGALIGFPEPPAEEETLSAADLMDEDQPKSEEIMVEEDATVGSGDPDLDMLDAAFDASTEPKEEAVVAPTSGEEDLAALDSLGEDNAEDDALSALDGVEEEQAQSDRTMVGFMPEEPPAPPPPPARNEAKPTPSRPAFTSASSGGDSTELRELRAKVSQLQNDLTEAHNRASEAESKITDLEAQLSSKSAEAEAARSTSGKSDKEFFALKEQNQKKDKELLKLRSELNERNKELQEKEEELVNLREREMQLDQQNSESSGELARRDAQIKTLTAKTEQLQNERKKVDQQLLAAKEEARSAAAKLAAMQGDLEAAQSQLGEVEELRSRVNSLESDLSAARDEASDAKRQLEEAQSELRSAKDEAENMRSQFEQGQMELDSVKNQLSAQATAFADEAAELRRRISELEAAGQKHEDRVTKFYQKIKGDEVVREKTKKALAIAIQLLDEQAQQGAEIDIDADVDNA